MAMTRAQMQTEVLARLGEIAGFFTGSEINQWLQDGVDDVCVAVEPLIASATTDYTASTAEYALPSDLISIKTVLWGGSGAWVNLLETTYEKLFKKNPDWEDDTATTPDSWYWRGQNLGLYPLRTTALTGGIRIIYTYRPTPFVNDSSTTGLPDWTDKAVVLYAVSRCLLKGRDESRAAIAMQEYRAEIAKMARKFNKSRKDHNPRIVPNQRAYRQYYETEGSSPIPRVTTT